MRQAFQFVCFVAVCMSVVGLAICLPFLTFAYRTMDADRFLWEARLAAILVLVLLIGIIGAVNFQ